MKKILILACSFFIAFSSIAQDIAQVEQKLTGGSRKKWIFSKTQITMGSRVKPSNSCVFSSLIFELSNKSSFTVSCVDGKTKTGKFSIEQSGVEEYYVTLNGSRFEVLLYTEKINEKERQVLLLRTPLQSKSEEVLEYFYYGE